MYDVYVMPDNGDEWLMVARRPTQAEAEAEAGAFTNVPNVEAVRVLSPSGHEVYRNVRNVLRCHFGRLPEERDDDG